MYDRILVPTDGSAHAEAAMEQAIGLARQYDAEIHVIHVSNSRRYDTTIDSMIEPLRKEGKEHIETMVESATDANVPVTSAIEVGRPARVILTYIDENDVDLVVIGTRGRGGLPNRLLGSVTNYLITHADVPIHVVPPAGDAGD